MVEKLLQRVPADRALRSQQGTCVSSDPELSLLRYPPCCGFGCSGPHSPAVLSTDPLLVIYLGHL